MTPFDLVPQSERHALRPWLEILPEQLDAVFNQRKHGRLLAWLNALKQLPQHTPSLIDLNQDAVTVGTADELSAVEHVKLKNTLMQLCPWRKGPFLFYGIDIDCEWRSNLKWNRLKQHISPLQGRTVLDVGCGNGYYALRMHGAGAKEVIGVDPQLLFLCQFKALTQHIKNLPVHVLPLGIDDIPADIEAFDSVFSMGVLYHRRSPINHLLQLQQCLKPGGELVLETLVVEGDIHTMLMPEDRYAQMRNVWFIPSPALLTLWLDRCRFRNVRVVDVTQTTPDEQRVTPWMEYQSLANFLDPKDYNLTVEGYPAPKRAIVIAEKVKS